MHAYRTHTCGALRASDAGQPARLSGWIHSKRDHGGLLFVDLRDHYGLTQCVFAAGSAAFQTVDGLRVESVITVTGEVVLREGNTVNPRLPTGEVELKAADVVVQSVADVLPMQVAGDEKYPDEIRLKYRFIDLRREKVHQNMMLRAGVIASIRRRMIAQGFTEFQTPILTASSPEGARDFLVPARLHPGKFYALPQAPQQFKQLAMVAGFDRYFQIAPCFRDEASRADRSPGEFYQLDFEMSYVTQEDVFNTIEPVMAGVFEEFAGGRGVTKPPFPRIPYDTAMLEFGSDKPDLRNPLRVTDVTAHFAGSGFGLFAKIAASGGDHPGDPGPRHGSQPAQLLRQAERVGARTRRGRAGLHPVRGGWPERADRAQPGAGTRRGHSRGLRRQAGRFRVFRRRQERRGAEILGRGPHQARPGSRPDRGGRVPLLLDHRFPDVRAERGNRAGRFQP